MTLIPVTVYFMAKTLTAFGDELDAEISDAVEHCIPERATTGGSVLSASPVSRMLRKFIGMLGNLFVALTVAQLVGWAPTFMVDFILVKCVHSMPVSRV